MKKSILTLLIASTLALPAQAQSAQNVLVVDVVNVLNNFIDAQSQQLKFNSAVEDINKMLTEKAQAGMEIQKVAEGLNQNASNPGLTADARDLYKKQLQDKIAELQKADADIKQLRDQSAGTLQQRQQAIIAEEVGKIRTAVVQIARKHNSNLVLNSAGVGAVVYADGAMDVTKEVLDLLNAGQTPLATAQNAGTGALSGTGAPAGGSMAPRASTTPPALSLPALGNTTAKPAGSK